MTDSTYNPCLLYVNDTGFGVVGLQINDTLILTNNIFATTKECQLIKAKLLAKKGEKLTKTTPIKFNKDYIKQKPDLSISLSQERQYKRLHLVTLSPIDLTSSREQVRKSVTPKDQYIT